ncbi:centromere/kinetochore protein zw10 homolog [Microplitis demolitor]|uniref:centromere/kinetochore protein zw10 homolog n=1 Tax=Microplitis demolitor TaxID=69319 RepID=UPI0004CCD827|nr:centromere/kinetochore protein zw10 homolog [Microplitis demolitor]
MSSLVMDVLLTESTGKMNAVELKKKVNDIEKEIVKLKSDVKEFIEDNYINFLPTLQNDYVLVEKSRKLIEDMKMLKSKIDDQIKVELSGSIKELKNLSQALIACNSSLYLSAKLLELEQFTKSVDKLRQNKDYVEAAKVLNKIIVLLNDDESHGDLQMLNIYSALKENYLLTYRSLVTAVLKIWNEHVIWTASNDDETSKDSKTSSSISLTIDCDPQEIRNIIQALHYLSELPASLDHFSTKLMKFIISPIIRSECSVFVDEEKVFNVVVSSEKKELPTYKFILHNLKMLFQFIYQHLNVDIDGKTFINRLSKHLWAQLSDYLLNNCINDIIPSSSVELSNFKCVEEDIHEFEEYLGEIGFITKDQLVISNYIKDIDKLYIDKISQEFLVKASQLVKKNLHDSFKYEDNFGEEEKSNDKYHAHVNNCTLINAKVERNLSKNTFRLPSCQISNSAKELMLLVRDILDEAVLNSDNSTAAAAKLYYTSRNVIEHYVWTVPEYHKKFLETIPQQVALFHNNCMYLAHNLMTLGHEYREKLPKLQKHNITYVDLSLKLRNIGAQTFLNHVKYQRTIITDIIKDSGLSQLAQNQLPSSSGVERALRQCIRQLELLKTVWFNVLPINVYHKTLGCILNSMIEDIIFKVTILEDISADAATELVNLFNMVVKRAPLIFSEENSVNRYVNKWQKMLELIKVLEASLKDIEQRWADGKGPLAREFTASQVKQLVRALFQNTERRSALLATIK